ncbi:MAG: N-acetylmannosamine-6-phosphate 2-epimerase [Firmicutes bacterium]|nr:N-acetylmannosamine-6-phosphate 2-epimerase [Bacillota bacterium]
MKNDTLQQIKGGLIVSCQALEHEPLHGPILMGAMALAAKEGGAAGIRANSARDVAVIKAMTGLPIIGIEKQIGPDGRLLITPTFECAERLVEAGADIVAFCARSNHPREMAIGDFVRQVKSELDCLVMADIGTIEDALVAEKAGVDLVASTFGYADTSGGAAINWELIKAMTEELGVPVIAEGGIWEPQEACQALELGVHAVVVGTAITRPQLITKRFVAAMQSLKI